MFFGRKKHDAIESPLDGRTRCRRAAASVAALARARRSSRWPRRRRRRASAAAGRPALGRLSGLLTFFVVGAIAAHLRHRPDRAGGDRARARCRPTRSSSFPATPAPSEIADILQARGRHRPARSCSRPTPTSTGSAGSSRPANSSSRPAPASTRPSTPSSQGKAILHSITIPEGLTSEQIVAAPLRQRHPHRRRHRDAARGHAAARHLQVRARHDPPADRQRACRPRSGRPSSQIWQRRSPDLPIKTPQELVILASIVEKETGRADERTPRRRRLHQPPHASA